MAQTGYTTIVSYHSDTAGAVPSGTNLLTGELAVNTQDRLLYTKNAAGVVVQVGGGATGGGGTNAVFYENDTNVTANYTITAGKNAMTAGPITIDSGVTVTVPTGSTWTVV